MQVQFSYLYFMKNIILLFLGVLIAPFVIHVQAQSSHWESVVLPGDQWEYTVPTSQLPNNWYTISYNASTWATGPSGIGYGDGDDATDINQATSVYMRKEFQINDLSQFNRVVLDIDYDDAYIAYVNGVEVGRNLLSGDNIPYNSLAEGYHEAMLFQGYAPDRVFIDKNLLVNGTNIIAVQVHNHTADSSDMSALPVISLEVFGNTLIYNGTPTWFQEPDPVPFQTNFTSSNLPIVLLDTDGNQEIPNEPKIGAQMKIIQRPENARNLVADSNNPDYLNFDGPIQIEVRGSSSSLFSKKQFALTTYDTAGEKDNVTLLNLPKENDWILSGLAFDTTFVRDYVSYKLSNMIGQYASRGEYCELVLNGQYQGIYMLLEKIKADDNRIDIKKLKPNDTSLPQITGGYVTKADKIEGEEIFAWSMATPNGWGVNFAHESPKADDITSEQSSYIQNTFEALAATASESNTSITSGYPSVIDVPSFVDFMILNEFASNPDAYQFSTYFHKDRRGKLRAGPVWDFNLTYGNDLFFMGFDRSAFDVWQFQVGNRGATFWTDLFNDPTFKCYMSKRWVALTAVNQPLHPDSIIALIDETVAYIDEAVARQQQVWNINISHNTRINAVKDFVIDRVNWISNRLIDTSLCESVTTPPLVITKINYHPLDETIDDSDEYEFIGITNNSGVEQDLTGVYFGGTGLSYQFPAGFKIEAGSEVVIANNAVKFESRYGFSSFDEFSRNLSNKSQEISLLDAFGNLIDKVVYEDSAPWPDADGSGSFLRLANIMSDNVLAESWVASVDFNPLSNKEVFERNTLLVYPNPVSTYLNVSITNNEVIKSVEVRNLLGQKVMQLAPNTKRVQMDMAHLDNGIYFIHMQFKEGTVTKKVLKK